MPDEERGQEEPPISHINNKYITLDNETQQVR